MTNSEIKKWAKEKVNGKRWTILPAIIVASILTNITLVNNVHFDVNDLKFTSNTYPFGWLFYFVEVGLTAFMVKFITDKKVDFNELFAYGSQFGRCIGAYILQAIYVFLWSLLFIIPGIIKSIAYSLVPMLLADDKYKDFDLSELLKKSEAMMYGHKADYFWLDLSFIGWHILAIFTLGLLEFWIVTYQKTAMTKFLYDVKNDYEAKHSKKEEIKEAIHEVAAEVKEKVSEEVEEIKKEVKEVKKEIAKKGTDHSKKTKPTKKKKDE